jgi:hypothetical protein
MRTLIASVLAVLAASVAAPVAAQSYGGGYADDGDIIRCESNDGRTRECYTGGGDVQLIRQLSRTACIEGRSWGHGRDGIWVSQGCRAEFRVYRGNGYYGRDSDYYHGRGDTFRCESNDGRARECRAGGGDVQLVRQLSRAACIEGRTWGQRRDGVWVSDGCRAEFRIIDGFYGNQGHGAGHGSTVRCESNDGRTRRCTLNSRGRAYLVRQLSRAACVEGRTWGSDYGSVWVSQGCRAEFAVRGGGWGDPGYGYGYQVFRCESHDGRRRECSANTRAGVQLVRQLSRAACIQGRTWGYGRNGIWVSDGCRGEFRSH